MSSSRLVRLARLLLLGVLCVAPLASAQIEMPDPKQMSGIPRPVTDLPNGSLSVRLIKGDLANNIAGHPVELLVDGKSQTVNTDAQGRAQFDKLPAGATIKAVAVVDGERLESQEFPAPEQGAIRLMLVATDKAKEAQKAAEASAPAIAGQVVLGGESRIVIEPGEESISFFYILDIMNNARAPMNPTVPFMFDMPEGAVSVGVVPGSSALATSAGRTITVTGPFPPGKTSVEVGGSLPVTSSTLVITQAFPAAFEQPVFIAKKEGAMTVTSPQFDRQQDTAVQGTPVIIGAASAIAAGQPITLTIKGLPYRSGTPRLVALWLALAIIATGGYFAVRTGASEDRASERRRLTARREKLLQELTRLEQDHRRGKVEQARFASRREELVASLESVYGSLDGEEGPDAGVGGSVPVGAS